MTDYAPGIRVVNALISVILVHPICGRRADREAKTVVRCRASTPPDRFVRVLRIDIHG